MPAIAHARAGMTWLLVFEYGMCFAAKKFSFSKFFSLRSLFKSTPKTLFCPFLVRYYINKVSKIAIFHSC